MNDFVNNNVSDVILQRGDIGSLNPLAICEFAGRTCYKSEPLLDYWSLKSSLKFVKMMMNNKHRSVLRHKVYVFRLAAHLTMEHLKNLYPYYKYMNFHTNRSGIFFSVNLCSLVEIYNDLMEENQSIPLYLTNVLINLFAYLNNKESYFKELLPIEQKYLDNYDVSAFSLVTAEEFLELANADEDFKNKFTNVTVKLTTDRGITHQLVRHTPFAVSQESSRYCDYQKDGISIIDPFEHFEGSDESKKIFEEFVNVVNETYSKLKVVGGKDLARQILPQSTASQIVLTGTLENWKHFDNVRRLGTTGKPHPIMQDLATKIHDDIGHMRNVWVAAEVEISID